MRIWAGTIRGSNEALRFDKKTSAYVDADRVPNFWRKAIVSTPRVFFFSAPVLVALLTFFAALDGLVTWGWSRPLSWRRAGAGCGCGFLRIPGKAAAPPASVAGVGVFAIEGWGGLALDG